MKLIPDTRWEVFMGVKDFESFQKVILKPIYLKPEVPEEIRNSIVVIEKLLALSYYEYELIDVAFVQAIFILEKVLKIKWKEINQKDSNKTFEKLIDWFYKNSHFETYSEFAIHQLRYIRNTKVHDETFSLGGTAFLSRFYHVIDYINDLYEDPALRVIRKNEVMGLNAAFEKMVKSGAIVNYSGKRLIIMNAYAIFIHNKKEPHLLKLSMCPIFPIEPFKKDLNIIPKHLKFTVKDWALNQDVFTATCAETEEELTIVSISDAANKQKYSSWLSELYGFLNWRFVLLRTTEPLEKDFINNLRLFHATCI